MKPIIPSINYHLTKACNMRCKFCYATFNDLGVVKHDFEKSKRIIDEISQCGFEKVTFAGGEPTLVRELPEIVQYAKEKGIVTGIVTNGSKLLKGNLLQRLAPNLDWLALSIDAVDSKINHASGRALSRSKTMTERNIKTIVGEAHGLNVQVKINTVVSNYNWDTDMNGFIQSITPDRWKILQALEVDGQNDRFQDDFSIDQIKFEAFVKNHQSTLNLFENALEPEELIKGSYLMISPEGKLYDNNSDSYKYSDNILEVGLETALNQINISIEKFEKRNGYYDWNQKKRKQIG